MRRTLLAASVAIFVLQSLAYSTNLIIKPTTTLQAQTVNNTSAANGFTTQTNGNSGAANVSKLDLHSLLYPGAQTKIYAHLMLWFGGTNHMNVGYSSINAQQVTKQVQDMISRGIDGVIIDWYGPGTTSDKATQLVMKEAENHPGFTFALMVDAGTFKNYSCGGCTTQQALSQVLQYAEQTYISSPAYLRIQGKPFITSFDVDSNYTVDWSAAKSTLASDPAFIFQNNSGFTHPVTTGSYSWVMPTLANSGMGYLSSFYKTGLSHATEQTIGATYKGFNDSLAAWGSNRIMNQQCGQTWLSTFSEINSMYSAGKPLDALQLVTWNDYEEGTEIESGIDNCVTVNATVSGGNLNWKITGNENTIDHYRIYISTDGQNLMPLNDLAAGNSTLNICSFSPASGNYQLFVQAVGKPSLRNQMSPAVSYTANCNAAPAALSVKIQAQPTSLKIAAGQTSKTTISLSAANQPLKAPVTFSCLNLPVNMACSFSAVTVSSDGSSASAVLSVSRNNHVAVNQRQQGNYILYACMLPFAVAGCVGIGNVNRKRVVSLFLLLSVLAAITLLSSCGGMANSTGANASPSQSSSSSYVITVVGNSSGAQASASLSVLVE